jgi:hypothetical protein
MYDHGCQILLLKYTKTGKMYQIWGAAVAQRYSGENVKINEIERTRGSLPTRATSFKKNK